MRLLCSNSIVWIYSFIYKKNFISINICLFQSEKSIHLSNSNWNWFTIDSLSNQKSQSGLRRLDSCCEGRDLLNIAEFDVLGAWIPTAKDLNCCFPPLLISEFRMLMFMQHNRFCYWTSDRCKVLSWFHSANNSISESSVDLLRQILVSCNILTRPRAIWTLLSVSRHLTLFSTSWNLPSICCRMAVFSVGEWRWSPSPLFLQKKTIWIKYWIGTNYYFIQPSSHNWQILLCSI